MPMRKPSQSQIKLFVLVCSATVITQANKHLPNHSAGSHRQYGIYEKFDVVGDSISANANPQHAGFGWVKMMFGDGYSDGSTNIPPKANTIYTLWPSISAANHALGGSKASDWASEGYSGMHNVTSGLPDLVVVYIGGNDLLSYTVSPDGLSQADAEEYRTNLMTIIDILRTNETVPDIILVNYYDLFDGYSTELESWGIPLLYPYTNLSEYTMLGNKVIEEVADEKGCYIVNTIYSNFMHHCYGEALGDTNHLSPDYVRTPISILDIHPNTDGHTEIYEQVYEKLHELSIPEPAVFIVCFFTIIILAGRKE